MGAGADILAEIVSGLFGLGKFEAIPDVRTLPDPAEGENFSFTVPGSEFLILLAFRIQLVTNGAAINRTLALVLDDGVNTFFEVEAGGTQGASTTVNYQFAAGIGTRNVQAVHNDFLMPLPRVILRPGFRIRTSIDAFQTGAGGDNLGAPTMYVISLSTSPPEVEARKERAQLTGSLPPFTEVS